MLTSPDKRFWFAKRARELEPPPLFRLLAHTWRPQIPTVHLRAGTTKKPKQVLRPIWNPWLWIK